MNARIIFIILAVCFGDSLSAQELERQVVATAGSAEQNAGLVLEQTVGEVIVANLSNADRQLSQGFHQGQLMTTGLDGLPLQVDYKIYPNPVTSTLQISMEGPDLDYYIRLYNARGQEIPGARKKVIASGFWQTGIDLSRQAAGSYRLVITDLRGNYLVSHQVVKITGQ